MQDILKVTRCHFYIFILKLQGNVSIPSPRMTLTDIYVNNYFIAAQMLHTYNKSVISDYNLSCFTCHDIEFKHNTLLLKSHSTIICNTMR